MQSFWPYPGVKIWKPSFKDYKQKSEWNCQTELLSSLPSTAYDGYRHSSKPNNVSSEQNLKSDHSALLPSPARSLKSPLSLGLFPLNTFSKSIIFKPQMY